MKLSLTYSQGVKGCYIPLLKASAIKLVNDTAQTKLAVSTAKTAVDEHNSKARSAAAPGAAGDAGVFQRR